MQSVIPRLVAAAALVVVVWGIAEARTFLVPICLSGLLAFLMVPALKLMRRIHIPELLAIIISAVLLVTPFLGFGWVLVNQGQAFAEDLPKFISRFERVLLQFANSPSGRRLHLLDYLNPEAIIERLAKSADQALQLVITGLGAVVSAGSQLALVLLFAVLMLATRRQIRSSIERLVINMQAPADSASTPVGLRVIDDTSWMIERFLVMRFLIVLIIGAADTLILYSSGVKYAVLLGGLLGIMTLVPAIGFIVGLIPALLVSIAMGHSALRTILMAAGLFVMSIIEGNVLTPAMVGRSINLNALSTFIGLFAGGLLWGIWGMLLSVPILGALRIVFSAIPALEPLGELLASGPQNGRGIPGEAGAGPRGRDKAKKTEAA